MIKISVTNLTSKSFSLHHTMELATSALLFVSVIYYSVIQVVMCNPAPGGFLQTGRPIKCQRNQPVDIGQYIPVDATIRRCYGCSCPDGYVDCRRINEAEECQLTRPRPATTKRPYPNMDIPEGVLANMAKASSVLRLDLDHYYKKYSANRVISFSTRPITRTTTTMAPQTTESEDYDDNSDAENNYDQDNSPELPPVKPTDDINADVDVIDEPQVIKIASSTSTPTTTTTTTERSTTLSEVPFRSQGSNEVITKSPQDLNTGLLSTETDLRWDDLTNSITNDGDRNGVIVAGRITAKPIFGDELRFRNQNYRSYKNDQERSWIELNGATMAKIGLIVYILLLVVFMLAIIVKMFATIDRQKQPQNPPDPKTRPSASVPI